VGCGRGRAALLLCVVGCSGAKIPGGDALESLGDPTATGTGAMSSATEDESEGEASSDGSGGGTCQDDAQDGDETDIDCGGSCGPCGPGQGCVGADDCTSQLCINEVCSGPEGCDNGSLDGDETDVDCGGSCGPCDIGDSCVDTDDCAAGVCIDQICTPPNCGDGMVQDDEDCDDGEPTPACTAICTFPVCGDRLWFTQSGINGIAYFQFK
jgi:hypothetical protein